MTVLYQEIKLAYKLVSEFAKAENCAVMVEVSRTGPVFPVQMTVIHNCREPISVIPGHTIFMPMSRSTT